MSDLEKLKDLLFGAEKQVLESITERVESRELRSADVADILPEAIRDSHSDSKELRDALRRPVGEVLQQEFRDDPQTYSDALYPVIGPAIRKSIMHALRTFSQQINEAVEQSLTPKGLTWRMQAWRAGVPFGEFIVQKTLLYRVEQAYLISRENGLLVAHAQHESATIKDSDAVSAMFTAIQDFVKESFSPDRTGRLETADMGEFTLWAVHGPHALLVCVIRGIPPRALRADLSAILERIHFRYGDAIRSYAGDTSSVPAVEEELEECLRFEARQQQAASKKKIPIPLLAVLLLGGGAIIYFAVAAWLQSQKLDRLAAALESTPGIYVAEARVDGGQLFVRGMRDPLAPSVADVAASSGLSDDDLASDMQPFQSLEPELIAVRAALQLGAPDNVSFAVQESRLIVSGPAPVDWQSQVLESFNALAGISSVQFELTDEDRVSVVQEFLRPPETVAVQAVTEGVALRGSAAPAWIATATARIAAAPLDWRVDFGALNNEQLDRLIDAVRQLSGRQFYFSSGATLTDQSAAELADFAQQLTNTAAGLAEFGQALEVSLVGFADATGNPDINATVAARRADTVATALAGFGFDGGVVTGTNIEGDAGNVGADPALRRVSIELQSIDLASPR